MIWTSVIAGIAAIIAATLGLINHQKITEVHVLVNGRLTLALAEIESLRKALRWREVTVDEEFPIQAEERQHEHTDS
jgi:hypothetical protein